MKEQNFYRKVFALVLPMAIQNLINVGVMATDVIMLGKVGETVLSGCSLGGQVFFILNLILFGITSGAAVLTSQYWGKKDITAIEKILGIAMKIAVIISLVFMAATLIFPRPIMTIFSSEAAVIEEGVKYLRIISFTYPIVAISSIYLSIMRSVERVVISTIVYACSLLVNIVANAILIFGLFGAPKMGIEGAAIGTLIARMVELAITAFYARKYNNQIKLRILYLFHMDKVLLKDFFKFSGPVIINEMFWGTGYSANAAIVGHLGSSAVAANSVAHVARQLAMVIAFGVGNATAIMIGKVIGENKHELAEEYGRRFVKLAFVFGIIGGTVIFMIRPLIISGLKFEGQTAVYMRQFLTMMSFYVVGQALNTTWIVGIFRAGGDTKFGMVLDILALWGGSILFGFLAAFVFHWNVTAVYFILLCDELIKIPFCIIRYKQKKWLNNITR